MIRFRLAELIADAQYKSGQRLTLKEVAEATGINRMTLSRMSNPRGYSTSTDTIDKLCKYFGCSVADVAQYVADDAHLSTGKAETSPRGVGRAAPKTVRKSPAPRKTR